MAQLTIMAIAMVWIKPGLVVYEIFLKISLPDLQVGSLHAHRSTENLMGAPKSTVCCSQHV